MTRSRDISALLGSTGTITASVLDASVSEALGGGTDEYTNPTDLPATADVGDQAFVSSTNRLYIWTGAGWYNIALINQTPTWDSGGQPDGSYVLAIDGSPTTITLLATDPDGLAVSYTATADSAFDTIATVSDSNNVFTITPKFTVDDDSAIGGSGSITFRATDGVNYASALSSFTITFVTGVENSKYTTALVTSVGSNGATNSTVTDSSTNNHTLTVNGDASVETFSPYRSGGYSYYFDGNGDYLTVATSSSASFNLSNTEWTIETWFYCTAAPSGNACLIQSQQGTNNWIPYVGIFIKPDLKVGAYINAGESVATQTFSLNTWNHIALSRNSSGTITLYLNGVATSVTGSYNISDVDLNFWLGKVDNAPGGGGYLYYYPGYISDVRVVKGTAVYTSNFTPPTKRLEAITNTSLLTCHLPYIKDGSSNDHSITVTGNVSAKPFGPYDYDEYDAATHGGSVYFDGTDDTLTLASSSGFAFGTGDYTIDFWIYATDEDNVFICDWRAGSAGGGGLHLTTGGYAGSLSGGIRLANDAGELVTTKVIDDSQWHHVAIVRSSGTTTIYIDGKANVSQSDTIDYTKETLNFCRNSYSTPLYLNAYLSDFRIVKGTAVYTTDFTPPTEPVTAITNTSLLISGTDASIIDKSQSNQLTLVGNTQSSTTVTKYGSSSIYLPGSGNSLTFNGGTATGDFTVECWWNPVSMGTVGGVFASASTSDYGMVVAKDQWWIGTNSSVDQIVSTTGIDQSGWYHIAIVRSGSTIVGYVNGSSVGTTDISADISLNFAFATRYNDNYTTWPSTGYIEDFRVTKGLARYTANFTPPTAALEG